MKEFRDLLCSASGCCQVWCLAAVCGAIRPSGEGLGWFRELRLVMGCTHMGVRS